MGTGAPGYARLPPDHGNLYKEPWAVGVDTASSRLHAVADSGWWLDFDCSKLTADPDERRWLIFQTAINAFATLPARSLVLIEEPISVKNGKTNRLLALAAGAVWVAASQMNCFTGWVDIAQWKKEIVGKGNANKADIEVWVRNNDKVRYDVPDLYDAHCLMLYAKGVLERETKQ